ncbi:MAG TPA: hypothetical protein DCG75_01300 [Bacteroidales bacterium]|nr:hypothetical protein [Bacteroidales bacterium]
MKIFNILSISAIILVPASIMSCTSNKNTTKEVSKELQFEVVQEAIDKQFNSSDSLYIFPNKDQSKILYLSEKKKSSVNPVNNIAFFVYDKELNEIIYQNKYANATIKWLNNYQLSLSRKYGIIETQDGDNVKDFIIDLNTKEVTEIKKENNKSNI